MGPYDTGRLTEEKNRFRGKAPILRESCQKPLKKKTVIKKFETGIFLGEGSFKGSAWGGGHMSGFGTLIVPKKGFSTKVGAGVITGGGFSKLGERGPLHEALFDEGVEGEHNYLVQGEGYPRDL